MVNKINQYKPDYAIHPGEILGETLEARGISSKDLAQRIDIAEETLSKIINGKAPVTPETAIRLENVLGINADIWNNLDSNYQLFQARQKQNRRFQENIDWARSFPLKELKKQNIIDNTRDYSVIVKQLFNFFGVSSIHSWIELYESHAAAFRKSVAFEVDDKAVAAWLRLSEIIAHNIETKNFNKRVFEQTLIKLRSLTLEEPEEFTDTLKLLCAKAGVALVFLSEFPKTRISGATRWLSPKKAMIALTLRYKTDDQFWFTFFHEAVHIIKHGKNRVFIDAVESESDTMEREADEFARDMLIPPKKYSAFVSGKQFFKKDIIKFSGDVGIAPGIVVGRLQHDGYIKYNWHNDLKRKF
jgi:HTH-type transcriptional regulator / antitoxin HigA